MPSGSRLHLNPRPGSATSWGKRGVRISLEPGYVLSLPAGWLHAVYTPEDSLVLGATTSTRSVRTQLAVFSGKRCRVDAECRFPHWVETVAYGAAADARHPAGSAHDAGARRLLSETLKSWSSGGGSLTASERRRLEAALARVAVDFDALESDVVGEAPKRTEDTLDAYVARGLQVTAAERAEFWRARLLCARRRCSGGARRGPRRGRRQKNDRDWARPSRRRFYDSDDSDASDEDDTTGLGIAELKRDMGSTRARGRSGRLHQTDPARRSARRR